VRVDRQDIEGVTVISVAEPVEVDIGNADEFKTRALEALGTDSTFVLDVGRVGFFDSAGMAALLSLQKRAAQRRGKVVLACLNRPVEEVFRMVGFDVVFEVYRDVPKAVAALKK
jgi:anti-anti-sigma factor